MVVVGVELTVSLMQPRITTVTLTIGLSEPCLLRVYLSGIDRLQCVYGCQKTQP